MSTEKYNVIRLLIIALGVFFSGEALLSSDEESVLQFYRNQARLACAEHSPVEQGVAYSFTATSYYKRRREEGGYRLVDSAVVTYYFTGAQPDSHKAIVPPSNKLKNIDFSYLNVFDLNYRFSFYPNDTGGTVLALGFDTDSLNDPRPDGLAIIDRYDYMLERLYLYYPQKEGYKRFSRIVHFTEYEGYLFPDTIEEVASKAGIFSTDHYHILTHIRDITVYPPKE